MRTTYWLLMGACLVATHLESIIGAAVAAEPIRKIVIAHRGASGYLPEHTLEAKAMAHAMRVDFIEQDVVLTRDNVPVVLHDIHLDTVTDVAKVFADRQRNDGRYYAIDFTLDEIKRLSVTERIDRRTGRAVYPSRFPIGQSDFEVPTLAEEIELIQGLNKSTGRDVGIYPEIKSPAWHRQQSKDISRVVLKLLEQYGYRDKEDNIYLQCFDAEETKRIRNELKSSLKLVQLMSPKVGLQTRAGIRSIAQYADGIGPPLSDIVTGNSSSGALEITDLVELAHRNGLVVHPYTFRADSLPDYAASIEDLLNVFLFKAGVDGVFTDHPDRAVSVIQFHAK